MNKKYLIFLVLFLIVGCKSLEVANSNYLACTADSQCVELMTSNANIVRTAVDSSSLLGNIFAFLASGLTGVLIGGKFKKKV